MQTKKCPYCASDLDESLAICPNCNEDIGKSWVITLIFCCYLGLFGAHNFYTKRTKMAIAQLILTLTIFGSPITIFWCLFDVIRILFDCFRDNYGNKLSRKPTKTSTLLLFLISSHRFYVKRYVSACIYSLLLISAYGLSYINENIGGLLMLIWFVWALFDFITILCGKFKDAEGQYIE